MASPGWISRSGDDFVQVHEAHAEAEQVEAVGRRVSPDQLRKDGQLPARDLNAGVLGAGGEAASDLLESGGIGLLDGYVVEHRDRIRADADHVVDVHGDAVDPDRVETPQPLGDDHLRADPVAGQREAALVVEAKHVGVVAGRERRPRGPAGLDAGQDRHQRAHGGSRSGLVDSRSCVGRFAHAAHSSEAGGRRVSRAAAGPGRPRRRRGRLPSRRSRRAPPEPARRGSAPSPRRGRVARGAPGRRSRRHGAPR